MGSKKQNLRIRRGGVNGWDVGLEDVINNGEK